MSQPNEPKNDQGEDYPNLPRAPIVEAVIHWLAQPGKQLDPDRLRQDLSDRVPDYPICQPQQGLDISATGGPGGASEVVHRTQWNGFRLKRDDEPFVAQFTPSGVVFSRLAPYDKWESFEQEGMRFWDLFVELAEPILVKRLGVRFINQIRLGEGEKSGGHPPGEPVADRRHRAFGRVIFLSRYLPSPRMSVSCELGTDHSTSTALTA